jgi:PKD repeat protein
MKQLLKRFLAGAVILSLLLALVPFSIAAANDGAVVVSVEAPGEAMYCTNITARVNIGNVTGLGTYQFLVSYNTSILEVIGPEGGAEGVTDGVINATNIIVDMWAFDPVGTPGVMFILGNTEGSPPGPGVSGDGYLCDIHFHVIGDPCNTSNITLSEGHLWDAEYPPNELPVAAWLGDSVHVAPSPTPPTIAFTPTSLSFWAIEGGANPPDQTLYIWNSGLDTLNWTATRDAPWLFLDGMSETSGTSVGPQEKNPVITSVDTWGMVVGDYYATITISDPQATNDPQTVPVSLEIVAPGALHADFTGTPRTGLAPASIAFTDETTGGTPPYSYEWDFGDSRTSTAENPTHIYAAAGTYTVALTVTDDVQDTDTETKRQYIVIVREEPGVGQPSWSVSNLHISPEQAQPNQQVDISVNIANVGEGTGTYNAALYVNGQLENSETVGVAAGSTRNVVFAVTRADAGTYDVSFAGLQGQFSVVQASWGGGLGTGGIIAIVVVVIVLILALVFLIPGIRKRE